MTRAVFFTLLILAAGPLAAQDENKKDHGFYIGTGAAFMRIDTPLSDNGLLPDNGDPIEDNDFKKTSIAAKIFAGYRIMRYVGIEVGYFRAFDVEETYCFSESPTDPECSEEPRGGAPSIVSSSAWTVELDPKGYTVAAAGFWPISDTFELMVKVGGVYSSIERDASEKIASFVPVKEPVVPAFNPCISSSGGRDFFTGDPCNIPNISKSGWDATGAFGVNFNHESGFSVRAEIEYFNISEIDEPWLLSLNAIYHF